MIDGLYRVDKYAIVAGFVVDGGKIVRCAPILRKKLQWWITQAVWVCK